MLEGQNIFSLSIFLWSIGLVFSCGTNATNDQSADKKRENTDLSLNQSQIEDQRKDEFYRENACRTGKVVSKIFMNFLKHYDERCNEEVDELIQSYLESGQDMRSPDVLKKLISEVKKIEKKYF